MTDIAGDRTTTSSVTVGSTVTSSIEVAYDQDWFRISLVAGQSIQIALNGAGSTPLGDPYLRLRDSLGNLLAENDDSGGGLNSLITFTATATGTYYIDAGAYSTATGGYALTVSAPPPPPPPPSPDSLPIATVAQFANQLSHGYWGGSSHHFNVTQGGVLTVNLTGLTAEGLNLARLALNQWSDVIGIRFSEVSSGGSIVFDDNQEGAFSSSSWSGGITSSSTVNVSTAWLASSGSGVNSYSFQTYVHEIGHALGLGHAGNYNGSASYPSGALFRNDGWPMSVMSYFSGTQNTYFAQQGFTYQTVGTPMIADIAAIGVLYGLSTTTRLGETTYGFNSNAGDVYNANLYPTIAYTVFDSGGIDTLDYSGFSQNQVIDLTAGQFSNVGGRVGNVNIAIGTLIENAIGGSGNDTVRGNAAANALVGGGGADVIDGGGGNDILSGGAGNDVLTGGAGNDTFRDTAAGHNGNRITDFAAGDRITFTDASLANFTYSLSGSILTFTGGSLTFSSALSGTFTATAATGGGVQLTIGPPPPDHSPVPVQNAGADFNGDGRDDILWRHINGTVTDWLGQANGGFAGNFGNANLALTNEWQIAGTGDFNGDGRSDILWRHTNGTVTDWLGQANGGFAGNFANANLALTNDWQIAGTGDFNGDGQDDVLWRHTNGTVTDWLGQANGGFAGNFANANLALTNDWQIAGTGDFNGDGRSDILWRHINGTVTDWLGQANGGFAGNFANANLVLTNEWQIAGTGDFNGDGRDDVLWRHSSGTVTDWLGQANGGFAGNFANANLAQSNEWQIAGTGDYNGDGRDDILWRHTNGTVTDWLGQANGGFVGNFANANLALTNDWQIQWNMTPSSQADSAVADWHHQADDNSAEHFSAFDKMADDWRGQSNGDLF